jgi:4-amino-4-deoxy-L-arabinose transferase-like glycosyltransferase
VAAGGVAAALLINPLLNVLSLLAVYALVRRLADPLTALLALLALLLQPAQLWQARFSSAEMLAQFFLWSGFALLIRLDRSERTLREAVLAGAALGAAQLARYDSVMVLAPVALVLAASLFTPAARRPVLVILGILGALVTQAWLHQRWVAPFYAPIPSVVQQALIVLSGILLTAGLAGLHPRTRAGVHHVLRGSWPRLLAIVVIGAWWMFVLFARPAILDGTPLGDAMGQYLHDHLPAGLARGLTGDDAGIGLYLRALWAWPALIAAMAGVLGLVWRERSPLTTAWLAGALAVGVVITYRIYNDHFLMWLARRFIPILVPLFAVGLAVACAGLAAWRPRVRAR